MTDDEQNLTALEEELRTLAAHDREEAEQLAADMKERMVNGVLAEYARKTVHRHMYRVGSAVALLAALAVVGVLLLPDSEPGLVQTAPSGTVTDAQPANAPAALVVAGVEPVGATLVPESAPEMPTLTMARNCPVNPKATLAPAAGDGMAAPLACCARVGGSSLPEHVSHILTTQEQPYTDLHAILSQAPTRSLQISCGNCTLTVTSGQGKTIYIFVQRPQGEKEVISLSSPSDTLPPQVRELLK